MKTLAIALSVLLMTGCQLTSSFTNTDDGCQTVEYVKQGVFDTETEHTLKICGDSVQIDNETPYRSFIAIHSCESEKIDFVNDMKEQSTQLCIMDQRPGYNPSFLGYVKS